MVMIHWDIQRWDTEFSFDNLKEYFSMIEGQFNIVREKEKKKVSREPPSGLSEEEYSE